MKEVLEMIRTRIAVYSISGIVFLTAAGLLLLFRPGIALTVICRLFGVLLLIVGGMLILRYLRQLIPVYGPGFLVLGIILVVVGISVFSNPFYLVRISGTLVSLFFIIYGVFSLIRLIQSSGTRDRKWKFLAAGAACELIIGILLLVAPVETSSLVLRLVGVILLYAAFSAIMYRRKVRDQGEQFRNEAENTASRFEDAVGRYTGKDRYGQEIIEGTARDVTDDTD